MDNSKKTQDTTRSITGMKPGHILHYRLLDLIGSGGMGEVFLAQDTKLDRLVALKVLNETIAGKESVSDILKSEAKAAAKLSHPNICQIYAIEETADSSFIAMEYIQGFTIQKLSSRDPIDFNSLVSIAGQLIAGIHAAHKTGIIHRDLKPSNLMIDKAGYLKILDFGLAVSVSDQTLGNLAGTLPYMSPEQLLGESIDYRSDFFSIGSILYELTTGLSPFKRESKKETIQAVLHEEPADISRYRPELPYGWKSFVNDLLHKEREKRPDNSSQLIIKLKEFQQYQSTTISLSNIQRQSIAIFPFINVEKDSELAYIADGFNDELITRFSNLSNLRVASRSAVEHLLMNNPDYKDIAKQLNFNCYLSGRINKSDSKVRLSVELVNASDLSVLWSEIYTKSLDELLTVESDIFDEIVSTLQLNISGYERSRLAKHQEIDNEAYTLYLKARHLLKNREKNSLLNAISILLKIIEKKPDFAAARAELATAYGLLYNYGYDESIEIKSKAINEAEKAIEIDPSSSQAHMSLFFVLRNQNIPKTITELKTAIALDANNYEAHHYLAFIYISQGLYNNAVQEERRALQIDPFQLMSRSQLVRLYFYLNKTGLMNDELNKLRKTDKSSFRFYIDKGWMHWCSNELSDAIENYENALHQNEKNLYLITILTDCYRRIKDLTRASDLLSKQLKNDPTDYMLLARAGQLYKCMNDEPKSDDYFNRALQSIDKSLPKAIRGKSWIYHHDKAWIYALQANLEKTLESLLKAIDCEFGNYIALQKIPDWEILQNDVNYQNLIKQLSSSKKSLDVEFIS